jgi:hypothetical protein
LAVATPGSDTFTTTTLLDALRGQDSDIDQLTVISINPGRAQFVHKFNDAAPGIRVSHSGWQLSAAADWGNQGVKIISCQESEASLCQV